MIPHLPNALGIVATENVVFRRRRSNQPLDEGLGEYSNSAQVVLGYFQNIDSSDLQTLYDPQKSAEIIAAGRILDATSTELLTKAIRNGVAEDLEMAVASGLLAAIANAIYGNFPGAATIANRFDSFSNALSHFQICALCCAAPQLVGKLFPLVPAGGIAGNFLENLEAFLRTGETKYETALRSAFISLRQLLSTAFDHAIWMSCEVCIEQVIKLSIAKTLKEVLGHSSVQYVGLLAKAGIKALLPPQFLALKEDNLIGNSANTVISLPTSTGKTLLAELCIYSAVQSIGKIGIFVVPYVALGRQIADRASKHLPDDWRVVRLFGGFKEPGAIASTDHKLFVVATPERLDALLRYAPETFPKIACVVFDEAHQIASGPRGVRLEGLIARFLVAQSSQGTGRMVFVSAVIPNVQEIAQWVGGDATVVVSHLWTPTCRRIAVWKGDGTLAWHHSGDPVSPVGTSPNDQIASIALPWPQRIVPTRWNFAENRYFESKNYDNLVYLCLFMWNKEKEPILCVCTTRDTSRLTAIRLADQLQQIEPILPETQKTITLIVTKYPHYTQLKNALLSGVAYHNASLPHDLRAAIEDAARKKELRCIVSTSTLAEGIDLPFRATVIADWLSFKGEAQVPFSPLLVRNIAGRCGRVGFFTEGDIVIYDNPIGERAFKAPGIKEELQKRIFFSQGDTGIKSAIEADFEDESVKATFESQFLALVAENVGKDHIEAAFTNHLLANRGNPSQVESYLTTLSQRLTEQEPRLATRNSPLLLTDVGKAVNQTGFSPTSCRRILQCLNHLPPGLDSIALAVHLLSNLGDLPEQGDSKFKKLVAKGARPPKTCVRIHLLPEILRAWTEGKTPIEIFSSLSTVIKSSRKPPISEWLHGVDKITTWDSEFEKFCDFLRGTIFEFLPWLLRACSLLAPHAQSQNISFDWLSLAENFQRETSITSREDAVG